MDEQRQQSGQYLTPFVTPFQDANPGCYCFSSGARLCVGAAKVKQAGEGVGLRIGHCGFRGNWDAAADIHLSWQVKIIE